MLVSRTLPRVITATNRNLALELQAGRLANVGVYSLVGQTRWKQHDEETQEKDVLEVQVIRAVSSTLSDQLFGPNPSQGVSAQLPEGFLETQGETVLCFMEGICQRVTWESVWEVALSPKQARSLTFCLFSKVGLV